MKKLRVTVDGKIFDVTVEMLDEPAADVQRNLAAWAPHPAPPPTPLPPVAPAAVAAPADRPASVPDSGAVLSPLAGKVVAVDVKVGADVAAGAQVVTLEAMKMNTFVYAPRAGKIAAIHVNPGDAVEEGVALLTLA
jgi:biotin carboxyl carrier protein